MQRSHVLRCQQFAAATELQQPFAIFYYSTWPTSPNLDTLVIRHHRMGLRQRRPIGWPVPRAEISP